MRKIMASTLVFFFLGIGSALAASNDQTPVCYGPTTNSDHLWRIAIKLKPSPVVNEDQVMLALLKYNPVAFDFENVNALKPGSVLQLPRLELIRNFSPRYAYFEVKRQNAYWTARVEKARQRHKQIEKRRRSKANLCATKVGKTLSAVIKEKNEEEVVSGRMTKSSSATKLATANEQQANFKIANSSSASKLTGVTNQVFKPGTSHLPETLNPDQQLANAATVTTRLNTLEMQNATLQHQIMALGQQLSAIQQQVGPLKAISALSTTSGPEKNTGSFGFKSMVIKLQQKLGTLGFIVAVLFGFMFIIFFLRGILVRGDGNRSRVVEPTPSAHHPTEDYDFMASQESIPSKLNLAHAYLDMGNTKGASDILNEVMVSGDAAQQAEAKALLDKIVK